MPRTLLRCAIALLALVTVSRLSAQRRPQQTEPPGTSVTVNGHRLWYRTTGHGESIILIAGGPGASHTYFWPFLDRLATSAQVIYFDAFGRGKSARAVAAREYSLAGDVEDVEALRRALGLGAVTVYGHSYGGIVAQAYALKYPTAVKRLILASALHSAEMWQVGNNGTSNRILEDQLPETFAQLRALRAKGILSCDTTYQRIQAAMPASMLYYFDPSNEPRGTAGAFEFNLDVYCQIAGPDADVVLGGDLATFDFRPRLRELRMPVLVMSGRFDRVAIPRFARQFAELLPTSTFVTFERSGHSPFIEEPARHDSVVRAFLRR